MESEQIWEGKSSHRYEAVQDLWVGLGDMMEKPTQKLTLDRPATCQIKVPGEIDQRWSDRVEGMTVRVEPEAGGTSITTLTCTIDQSALQGLLRRLYSLGLPLISVNCVED